MTNSTHTADYRLDERQAQTRRTPSLQEGFVMKRLNLILASFLTVFIVGCATMKVKTDYDRDAHFPDVKTFNWLPQPEKPVTDPIAHNSLMDKRIKKAVDRELTGMGYQKQSENPALLIVYHTGLKDKVDVTSRGYGYGPRYYGGGYYGRGYYGRGYGAGGLDVRTYKEGTLILDFVDPKTMQLIWRGWAVDALNDLENASMYIDKAVKKILAKFPPTADKTGS